MDNIKEIPLLFSTPMVHALLEGRKTQTRRVVKLDTGQLIADSIERVSSTYFSFKKDGKFMAGRNCHYGKPGDLLWVRETFGFEDFGSGHRLMFKTDGWVLGKGEKWRPSIHLPKVDARIWLMVEEIRVERLQDITPEDAKAEGIEKHPYFSEYKWYLPLANGNQVTTPNPIDSFTSLWMSINGTDSWEQNPWIWVIKFRTLSTTGKPSEEVIFKNYKSILTGDTSVSGLRSSNSTTP